MKRPPPLDPENLMQCDRDWLARQWRRLAGMGAADGKRSRLQAAFEKRLADSRARVQSRRDRRPRPEFDPDLPITRHREEIAAAIEAHPVVVIAGETGSGKSTQIPKFCLEAARGVRGMLHLFHTKRGPARRAYARFVADGVNADDPFNQMPRPGFLGTESFIETILEKFDNASVSTEVPKKLRPARSLEQIARAVADRDQAITEAYRTGAYTLTEIARHFGIHQSMASRIARRERNA